jgi:hypothetical protein
MDMESLKFTEEQLRGIKDGEWITDIPGMGDVRLKVRGLSASAVVSCKNRKLRALVRKDRDADGTPKHEASMRVGGEVLAEMVLLDWDGITTGAGKPVLYDAALARKWCTDPRYVRFADAVAWAAQRVDDGVAEQKETATGN